jgi:hypothetical protein
MNRYCFAWTLTGLVLLFLVSGTTLGYTLYICLARRWRRWQRHGWGRQRSDVRPVNKPCQIKSRTAFQVPVAWWFLLG